jgi:hypothetical protein
VVTRGPGSEEGFGEVLHWRDQSSGLNNAEKAWLLEQAAKHVTDPARLAEARRWISDRRRNRRQAEQLCKRWGITLPNDRADLP